MAVPAVHSPTASSCSWNLASLVGARVIRRPPWRTTPCIFALMLLSSSEWLIIANYLGLLTTFGGSQVIFVLRAWQPQAAMPAAQKTRAAAGGEESST